MLWLGELVVAALAPIAPDIPRRVTSATAPVIPVILRDFMSRPFYWFPYGFFIQYHVVTKWVRRDQSHQKPLIYWDFGPYRVVGAASVASP